MSNIIEMKNITKRFPGIIANDDVSFSLRKGEIHALLGENGAGKSTLMSILFGFYRQDEGVVLKNGEEIIINSPNDANNFGIGMVHQHFKLIDVFTVLDNIILGSEKIKKVFIDRKSSKEEIKSLSEKYSLHIDLDAKIEDINVGMQQRTEILKMLYRNAEVLIFDEPTAVLTPQEIEQLMIIMKNLTKEGHSIIFITHKLDEIMSVCDRVTVLRRGKYVETKDVSETTKEELSQLMIGHKIESALEKKSLDLGENVLTVKNLTVMSNISHKMVVDDVSFRVNRGEIVCIAGIDGNGQSEVAYALSGIIKPNKGSVFLNYYDVTKRSIRFRNDHGLSHIPEDRHKYGMILEDTLSNNLVLKKYHLYPYNKKGIINQEAIDNYAQSLISEYDIRSGQGIRTISGAMSGGNQQKAVLAREIDFDNDFILSVQTVRGLDVGAVNFAHKQLIKQRDRGKAVLLVSFDLEEVFSVSDRILVMYQGQIVKNVLAKDITIEELGLYMSGVKKDQQEEINFTDQELEKINMNVRGKVK